VKCSDVCRPKESGGLGIKNLRMVGTIDKIEAALTNFKGFTLEIGFDGKVL
jgi:hypothetical protein